MKSFSTVWTILVLIVVSCNNADKKTNPEQSTTTGTATTYAGRGNLRLQLRIDGESILTDSTRYTVNEYGGMQLSAWGQRLTEGTAAYTYTLSVLVGNFHGADKYAATRDLGTIFWQNKSYYIPAAEPGSVEITKWEDNDISGSFDVTADDGTGHRKRLTATFRD